MNPRPLIAHVLYRLDTGGMERVVVSIINGTNGRYRHAVICLAGFGTMREEITDSRVPCLSLDKRPGKDWHCYVRLWKTLRRLEPDLVATYNLGALDAAPVARLAGVRRVVHAEHGRDAADPDGSNRKYRLLRRWLAPFIACFVAVSNDLAMWLREGIGLAPGKVTCIPNGIDTACYRPATDAPRERPLLGPLAPPGTLLIGSVGRLDAVKDQASLVTAFKMLCNNDPGLRVRLHLVIIGEGRERQRLEKLAADMSDRVHLLGNRADVAPLLRECDIFALSSRAEGIPLTVLEAMASGLPVVATDVGGVGEVVVSEQTGMLVAPSDPAALAAALDRYIHDPALRCRHGGAARARVECRFGLPAMVSTYAELYDRLLGGRAERRGR